MNAKLFQSPVYFTLKLISQWEPHRLKRLVKRDCVNLSRLLSAWSIPQYPLPFSRGPQYLAVRDPTSPQDVSFSGYPQEREMHLMRVQMLS